jgi:hypothetical protein
LAYSTTLPTILVDVSALYAMACVVAADAQTSVLLPQSELGKYDMYLFTKDPGLLYPRQLETELNGNNNACCTRHLRYHIQLCKHTCIFTTMVLEISKDCRCTCDVNTVEHDVSLPLLLTAMISCRWLGESAVSSFRVVCLCHASHDRGRFETK